MAALISTKLYRDTIPTLQKGGAVQGPVGAGQELCHVDIPTSGTYEITISAVGSVKDGNPGNGGYVGFGDETVSGGASLFQMTTGMYGLGGLQRETIIMVKSAGSSVHASLVFSMPAGDSASAFITARLVS